MSGRKIECRCGLCGRELEERYTKLVIRSVEARGYSKQMHTTGDLDLCRECEERLYATFDVIRASAVQ